MLELLHEARKMLKSMANVVYMNTDIAQEITVCGDLHGSLDDLFVILHKVRCILTPHTLVEGFPYFTLGNPRL
jgi:hypothetical protein